MWIGLLQLAIAQSVVLEHRVPTTTELGLSSTALVGLDAWQQPAVGADGGATGELRASGAVEHGFGQVQLMATYGGLGQLWLDGAGVDAHVLELGLGGRSGLGAVATTRASLTQGWVDAWPAASFRRPHLRATVGPVLRAGEGLASGGAAGELRTDWSVSQGVEIEAVSRLAWHALPELPETAAARVSIAGSVTPEVVLGGGLALIGALGGAEQQLAGLTPGNSAVVRPETWLRAWLGRAVALQAEGAVEIGVGSVPYSRGRLLAGVHLAMGRVRASHQAVPEGAVRLQLEAPDASQVAVAGSFSNWEPVPMVLDDGVWAADIDLSPGVYEYVYLVDGRSVLPPESSGWRDDGFGGRNGLLVVEPGAL